MPSATRQRSTKPAGASARPSAITASTPGPAIFTPAALARQYAAEPAGCPRPTASGPRPAHRGRPRRQPPVPVRSTRSCPARADDQPWDSLPNIPQDMNVAAAAGFQAGEALPADGRGPARESPVPRVSNTLRLIRNTPGLRPPPFPLAVSRPRSSSLISITSRKFTHIRLLRRAQPGNGCW